MFLFLQVLKLSDKNAKLDAELEKIIAPRRAQLQKRRQEAEENRRREQQRAQEEQQRLVASSSLSQYTPSQSVYTGRQLPTEVPAQILKVSSLPSLSVATSSCLLFI